MTARYLPLLALIAACWNSAAHSLEKPANSLGKTVPKELNARLNSLIDQHKGTVAVLVKHLPTGETFAHNADRPMPTASLIKFPVLVSAHQAAADGKLSWDTRVELTEDDKVPGSGILTQHFSAGTSLSLRDAARLMIVYSDNTATNLVIDAIGIGGTAQAMEQLQLPNTKLHAKVYRRDLSIFPERSKKFGLGSTTASEIATLFEKLWNNQLVSVEACDAMKKDLFACEDGTKIARYLPPKTKFAHKSGEVSQSRCDAGVIDGPSGATVVCVLTTANEDQEYYDDNPAHLLCSEIGRAVYAHFHEKAATQNAGAVTLANGDAGELVKSLQRTLNKRLEPSPELSLDGDFGPATERAVIRFQKAQSLVANGVVEASTWKALGELVTTDAPQPPPEKVNREVLPKAPLDPLDGVPFVSCKAWCLMEAVSGKLVDGFNADTPLDMASTTKIMTAVVAMDCCLRDPSLLEKTIVFSKRADDTVGSTSDIAAGEKVTVHELFYGLLLPSGNDASVAIGETFGRYVSNEPAVEMSDADSYDRFIRAMNDKAKKLGMDANFTNTHGLTEPGHVASAKSLAILAREAMKNDLFRKVVATRQRGYTLQSQSGYTRNIVWKNTNRLLKIDGYSGVKTGTTNAAGACLVSYGERNGAKLIGVVLGAPSTDARYSETRNLFRWGWGQLNTTKN